MRLPPRSRSSRAHSAVPLPSDGEGATKLLECRVSGARSLTDARTVAKSVICSSLVKAAMFGADANWGRVLCAIGYSGADADPHRRGCVLFAPKRARFTYAKSGAGRGILGRNGEGRPLRATRSRIDVTLHDGSAAGDRVGLRPDLRLRAHQRRLQDLISQRLRRSGINTKGTRQTR